jgi:hypothetical protein
MDLSLKPAEEESISGDDIVDELLRNMKAGRWKLRQTVWVPAVFNVYLHPDAYSKIEGILADVAEEAKAELQENLAELNRSSFFRRNKKYRAHPWVVRFLPDYAGRLAPLDIEVVSEFGGPDSGPDRMDAVGAKTIRIGRTSSAQAGTAAGIAGPPTKAIAPPGVPGGDGPLAQPAHCGRAHKAAFGSPGFTPASQIPALFS